MGMTHLRRAKGSLCHDPDQADRDIIVGISGYSELLWDGLSGDRIRGRRGARLSQPVQTGPETQPVFCRTGTRLFSGVKRSGRGINHPPHLASRLKKQ